MYVRKRSVGRWPTLLLMYCRLWTWFSSDVNAFRQHYSSQSRYLWLHHTTLARNRWKPYHTVNTSARRLRLPLFSINGENQEERTEVQGALKQVQERTLDKFIENKAPAWLMDLRSQSDALPFSCTGCGNCCRTQGDVYLDPSEIFQGAKIRNTTAGMFVKEYASHFLSPSSNPCPNFDDLDNDAWVLLKASPLGACIFLDEATNQCGIYEARPVQCRTYPFWPVIMQSPKDWNDECRRPVTVDPKSSDAALPLWDSEIGGCEGMKPLEYHALNSVLPKEAVEHQVSTREASRQLLEFMVSNRRFPISTQEVQLNPDQFSHGNSE